MVIQMASNEEGTSNRAHPDLGYQQPGRVAHRFFLQSIVAAVVVSNADGFIHAGTEDLSIADFAGLRGTDNCIFDPLDHVVGQHHLDLNFRNEIHGVLSPAIDLCVPLLSAMPADLENGHSLHADLMQRVFDGLEF